MEQKIWETTPFEGRIWVIRLEAYDHSDFYESLIEAFLRYVFLFLLVDFLFPKQKSASLSIHQILRKFGNFAPKNVRKVCIQLKSISMDISYSEPNLNLFSTFGKQISKNFLALNTHIEFKFLW